MDFTCFIIVYEFFNLSIKEFVFSFFGELRKGLFTNFCCQFPRFPQIFHLFSRTFNLTNFINFQPT